MIPRYSRPEMTAVWSEETKFQIWFEIEAHACDAQAKLGVIPTEAAAKIWQLGKSNSWQKQRQSRAEWGGKSGEN